MLKILRRHQKKILAVFTAGLMIVFIVDIGLQRRMGGMGDDRGRVVGKIGEKEIFSSDLRQAEDELRFLASSVVMRTNSPDVGQQWVPVLLAMVPEPVVEHWLDNPAAYVLLLEEARRMPVYVDSEQVAPLIGQLGLRQQDTVRELSKNPQFANAARGALVNLLMVTNAFERAMDVIKHSNPEVQHNVVREAQRVTLDFVSVDAKPYVEKAPDPTEEQLRTLFDKYASVPPQASLDDSNPLGFGYQVPPQVKLQYLAVPREQVRQVVQARKTPHRWETEAHKYYLQHQRDFETITTDPTTRPTTRPFEEVRDDVYDRLMAPDIKQLTDQITRQIQTTMQADYEAWAKANPPTTAPAGAATAPAATQAVAASSLGAPYGSFEYLQELAEAVQKQRGVLPAVHSIAEPQSEEQLQKVEGIGPIIASEVFDMAAPFVQRAQRAADEENVIQILEPAGPRQGPSDTVYFYRLTEATPAHPPTDLAEVRDQVVEDARKLWAWEHGRAEAQKLLDATRAAGELKRAAGDRTVTTAGPFAQTPALPIPGFEIEDLDARIRFVRDAYQLVSTAATQESKQPLRLIELPDQMQVLVAQLDKVETQLSEDMLYQMQVQLPRMIRQQLVARALPWFTFEAVSQRLNYTDLEPKQEPNQPAGAARQAASEFPVAAKP